MVMAAATFLCDVGVWAREDRQQNKARTLLSPVSPVCPGALLGRLGAVCAGRQPISGAAQHFLLVDAAAFPGKFLSRSQAVKL